MIAFGNVLLAMCESMKDAQNVSERPIEECIIVCEMHNSSIDISIINQGL